MRSSSYQAFLKYLNQQALFYPHIEEEIAKDVQLANKLLMKAFNWSESELFVHYSQALNLPVLSDKEISLSQAYDGLSQAFLYQYQVLCLDLEQSCCLVTSNPLDDYVSQAVSLAIHKPLSISLATSEQISRALERLSTEKTSLGELNDEISEQALLETFEDVDKLKDLASEAPIVRLVNLLVANAIRSSASDIHIEPFEQKLRVRYRIDGLLQDVQAPPAQSVAAVISRIKIMAKLDIAERRLPQDGRIKLRTHGHRVDLRISTIPSLYGESVVIRILDKESLTLNFNALGFDEENISQFRDLINRQQGILLVTGPTGSGKTTTLYTALSELNVDTKKIMTVEDPVEYQLDGIIQMQAKPDIGLGFAETLRSIVRQDPDIIMIGEMRDKETAKIAMQSALTGHFVLSTLHTNDVGSSITRLQDIGVEEYLITSTVAGVIAQRLVRRLCSKCKEKFIPDSLIIEKYHLQEDKTGAVSLYRPVGCSDCGHTGYAGRTVIIEQLALCDEVRHAIMSGANGSILQQLARSQGMLTMREDGIKKAQLGLTSLEEVLRITDGQN